MFSWSLYPRTVGSVWEITGARLLVQGSNKRAALIKMYL